MKSRLLVVAMVAVGLAMPALANDYTTRTYNRSYEKNYDKTQRDNQMSLKASFENADKNRDGKLTIAEQEALFNNLDKDRNGILNVAEQRVLGQKADRIDRNDDDQISLFELESDYAVSQNNHAWGYANNAPDNAHPNRN